ncbi:P-loop NTPase fold protein [Actinokineospora terrae]|uniref:WD domain-containing protein, G-beta repeat-containing protein n=1 Tax=Actinokineospora terrae TaxID=155974 RepID=A0A1H9P1U9_9PSEU|nr:P-loop NTPase fold protein [Actinokineospora terrae]SER42158.1 WD domain-containing protein, G-beta repeat-containing protein [Actinokineospora terrae]
MAPQREIRLHIEGGHSGADLASLSADSGYVLTDRPDDADQVVKSGTDIAKPTMAPYREQRVFDVGTKVTSVVVADEMPAILAAGCEDGVLRLWNLQDLGERPLRGHAGPVWSVAASRYSPGQVFSAGQDGTVRAWPLYGSGDSVTLYQHNGIANAVAAGKGSTVISGGDDNSVFRWTNGDVRELRGHNDFVTGVALADEITPMSISPDGQWLIWGEPDRPASALVPATCVAAHQSATALGTQDREVHVGDSLLHLGAVPLSIAITAINGTITVAIGGEDGLVRLWEPDTGGLTNLPGHTGPVRGVAFGTVDERPVVVSGGDDGTVRVWARPTTDHVEWAADAPATQDALHRRPLATLIAEQLRQVDSSFLVHLDGPWGSGKSTILGFLRTELDRDFTTVPFDAWREAGVGPSWWALLTALRTAIRGQRGFLGRIGLRISESFARLRRVGAPVVFAFILLLALTFGVWWLFASDFKNVAEIAKSVTGAIAGVGTLWAGALVASRFLLWDSARGARLFEQSNTNPMLEVNRHFSWLAKRAKRPVVFLVDDLDRCKESTVVELLDTVQTLVRDTGPHFIVAADGAWIRAGYEQAYEKFSTAVAEPGRPLGYLFLDKFFQLRVQVPAIDSPRRQDYLRQLLRTVDIPRPREIAAEEGRVLAQLGRSVTEAQVVDALSTASPVVRGRVAGEALRRMSTPAAVVATEHSLQRYGGMLPPNPRAMKRFINTYSTSRAVRTLEGNVVPVQTLALWTVVEIRWPSLADYLRATPEAILLADTKADQAPEALRPVFADEALVALAKQLTPDLIREACGG